MVGHCGRKRNGLLPKLWATNINEEIQPTLTLEDIQNTGLVVVGAYLSAQSFAAISKDFFAMYMLRDSSNVDSVINYMETQIHTITDAIQLAIGLVLIFASGWVTRNIKKLRHDQNS